MKKYYIDELDCEILNVLNKNSRLSFRVIAAKLSVSVGTIHFRLKRLQKRHLFNGSTLIIDYKPLGYAIRGYVMVYVQNTSLLASIHTQISTEAFILGASITTGESHIIYEFIAEDIIHAKKIKFLIEAINGVSHSEFLFSKDSMGSESKIIKTLGNN